MWDSLAEPDTVDSTPLSSLKTCTSEVQRLIPLARKAADAQLTTGITDPALLKSYTVQTRLKIHGDRLHLKAVKSSRASAYLVCWLKHLPVAVIF